MNLVFAGTGAFAVPALEALLDSRHDVRALVTQPDRPAGRGHRLRVPPTKTIGLARGIPVLQPARIRSDDSVSRLREIRPECIVVVAYGQIIPRSILDIPAKGIINVHGSILPRYRGAAPVQWAIARGETSTGVTTMLMNEGLDTGPILLQRETAIADDDTGGSLEARLASLGASLLIETLDRWEAGDLKPAPQDDANATLAPRIKKEDALVDFRLEAPEIHNRVRAFDPWPVAYLLLDGAPVRVWKTRVAGAAGTDADAAPGRILGFEPGGIVVACGGGTRLVLEEVQAAGRARTPGDAFARGRRLSSGDALAG
jgi:methionyl-tRNA formyltransferase